MLKLITPKGFKTWKAKYWIVQSLSRLGNMDLQNNIKFQSFAMFNAWNAKCWSNKLCMLCHFTVLWVKHTSSQNTIFGNGTCWCQYSSFQKVRPGLLQNKQPQPQRCSEVLPCGASLFHCSGIICKAQINWSQCLTKEVPHQGLQPKHIDEVRSHHFCKQHCTCYHPKGQVQEIHFLTLATLAGNNLPDLISQFTHSTSKPKESTWSKHPSQCGTQIAQNSSQ